jgi:hypothetical protein
MTARSITTAAALAVALSASAAAQTPVPTGPQPPNCPLFTIQRDEAREVRIGDTGLVARDPYNGLISRNRLFFSFSARGDAEALARVARVEWALDGTTVRMDPRAPFEWKGLSGSSRRLPAGGHVVRVTVVPKDAGAAPQSAEFGLFATNCQAAGFDAFDPYRISWYASAEQPANAPPLERVEAVARSGVRTALPASVRGRRAGTLHILRAEPDQTLGRPLTRTLRVPRRGTTLLRRGALRVVLRPGHARFLTIDGLPAGAQWVRLELTGAGRTLVRPRGRRVVYRVLGRLTGGGTTVGIESGFRTVARR